MTRITKAVERRYANMRQLYDVFMTGNEISKADICELLQITDSGARKYINEMRNEGFIVVSRYIDQCSFNPRGTALYKVHANPLFSVAFKDSLDGKKLKGLRTVGDGMKIPEGRNIHILEDDMFAVVPKAVKIPKQWNVLATFFGMQEAT